MSLSPESLKFCTREPDRMEITFGSAGGSQSTCQSITCGLTIIVRVLGLSGEGWDTCWTWSSELFDDLDGKHTTLA